ncbi:MAG: hypothetical protein HUJ59_02015 [Bacilli bacterium]|nr:hypothetical protein [Bacilli bacterium]
MKENKLKDLIEFIGLDYKKEIWKIIGIIFLFLTLGVVAYFFLKLIMLPILCCIIAVVAVYLLISSYSSKKNQILKDRDDELISVINYFRTFINNHNNVYQSFKKILIYSSDWMKDKLERFLSDIDSDKSVKPFIDFANNFQFGIAKNLMLSIYQMVDEGEDNLHFMQFDALFLSLTETHMDEMKSKKEKSLNSMQTYPMIATVGITIILSFSIISVVGDLINVI